MPRSTPSLTARRTAGPPRSQATPSRGLLARVSSKVTESARNITTTSSRTVRTSSQTLPRRISRHAVVASSSVYPASDSISAQVSKVLPLVSSDIRSPTKTRSALMT